MQLKKLYSQSSIAFTFPSSTKKQSPAKKQQNFVWCTFSAQSGAKRPSRRRWAIGFKICRKRKMSRKAENLRDIGGAPSGTRTRGPLIKSQLLYQLS